VSRYLLPPIAVNLLLAATFACISSLDPTPTVREASVPPSLPVRVGEWTGRALVYCHSPICAGYAAGTRTDGTLVCPLCGSEVASMLPAEKALLPTDTILKRMVYQRGGSPPVVVSLVVMGVDRGSIHRPELCLEGQGRRIGGQHAVTIPLESGRHLASTWLDLTRTSRNDFDRHRQRITFVYWFFAKERQEGGYFRMLFRMSADLVLRNSVRRWAYVSLSRVNSRDDAGGDDELRQFIHDLWLRLRSVDARGKEGGRAQFDLTSGLPEDTG